MKTRIHGAKGETRIVRKFLIIPRTFNGERRWLESADIVERVDKFNDWSTPAGTPYLNWVEIGFADILKPEDYATAQPEHRPRCIPAAP